MINFFSWGAISKTNFQTFKTGSKIQNFSKIIFAYLGRKMRFFCFGHFFDISYSNGEKCTDRFWEGGVNAYLCFSFGTDVPVLSPKEK